MVCQALSKDKKKEGEAGREDVCVCVCAGVRASTRVKDEWGGISAMVSMAMMLVS